MRFWVIGCAAIVAVAGCGDKTNSPVSGATPGPLTALKIDDVKTGKGPAAKAGDIVIVEYTGSLANGTVFDASSKHGGTFPVTVGAGKVIKGWDQGLLGMKEGGERKLSIPASLGYGDNPMPNSGIGPGADLFFDIKCDKMIAGDDANSDTIVFLTHGTGHKAADGDTVHVNYSGKLADGKIFDAGPGPLDIEVGGTGFVPGFQSAMKDRQVGDHFEITIPPQWGYGAQPKGPIPANSWLIFDVTVLSIAPKK